MKTSTEKLLKISTIVTLFLINFNFCLGQNLTVNQDSKFEELLVEKRKYNSSLRINEFYKIQIFNGPIEEAKKTLTLFKKENLNYDATIIFNTPTYKVWVGNYKTRIEAEKNILYLKKKYPNLILVKPSN
ncbi:SPOR domain-containing protein [Flavobacterium sp.]|uniref:SPOR domain-containing protein n=1 Tax=Flavobacterium sp. TaxID=239 RepID=UPI0037539566